MTRGLAIVLGIVLAAFGVLLTLYGGSLIVAHLIEGSYETPLWIVGTPMLVFGVLTLAIGASLLIQGRGRR